MAYESQTYEVILKRMMDTVTTQYPNLDDREGSIIYNALAPAAAELAIAYIQLDNIRNESFVNTASREYALIGCEQMGIDTDQFNASAGTFKGEFNVEVSINSRWNCDLFNYTVTEYVGQNSSGYYEYKMVCESAGTDANNQTGTLTPITENPTGLTHCELTECLIEGENEKTDEEIKQTYYEYVNSTVSDGNVAQYERWCREYPGIGNFKIEPLWAGANTVKVSILSSSNRAASRELVTEFQQYLDKGVYLKETVTETGSLTLSEPLDTVCHYYLDNDAEDRTFNDPRKKNAFQYSDGTITDSVLSTGTKLLVFGNNGMGNGVAPIGAFVTVSTGVEYQTDISATITMRAGYTDTSAIDTALTKLFSEISYNKNVVSYLTVGATILAVEGVENVTNLIIDGYAEDLQLSTDQIPVLGETTWTVSN